MPQDELNADIEVEKADVQFVDEFGGSLGFLESLNAKQLNKQAQKGPAKHQTKRAVSPSDSDSDQQGPEAAYERAPRHRLQEQQSSQKSGLPTKNLHGEVVYAKAKASKLEVANIQVSLFHSLQARKRGHLANVFWLLSSGIYVTVCKS